MRIFVIVFCFVLFCLSATGQAAHENNFGLYITPTPDITSALSDPSQTTLIAPQLGVPYDIHLVCSNPFNFEKGEPIRTIGGYEGAVQLPPNWIIINVQLPPNVLNLHRGNDVFFCVGFVDVDASRFHATALLATISLITFTPPGTDFIHLAPIPINPSIPGQMALTDGDDGYTLHQAYPSSGDLAVPVMGINTGVVPTEDASWSGVKALYR